MLRRESDKDEVLINHKDIVFGNILGAGGFGEVYHGTWRHNDVAIKKLLMKKITPESAQEFETESQIMARLRSPNIVQFYGYTIEPERCIVMEYCPNGSLFSVLRSDKPLEWSVRVNIALGAAKGLAFLHEERILHRDIKSLNILLTAHFEAKLTDFGLSKLKAETKSHSAATKSNSAIGTLQWMAPELFDPEGVYTGKSDIYSLGVTFWELSSRKIPFEKAINPMLVPMWIGQGKRETIPSDCPPAFGTLIQQCWSGEPSARPDTNAIITQLKKSVEALSAQKTNKAPSPNPSPFPAPSGPQYLDNFVSEGSPKPLVFSPMVATRTPESISLEQLEKAFLDQEQEVVTFVRLIAEGEQDQAEALLQKDATLALFPSDVTDLSGRTFKGITGFQYAVWALDWHMWTMIRKYLHDNQAAGQIKAMDKGAWVLQHGESGDWFIQNFVDALQKRVNLLNEYKLKRYKLDETETKLHKIAWNTLERTQHLLPVHVINEYCHPTRPFHPCPDFTQSNLPRTRKTEEGDWFSPLVQELSYQGEHVTLLNRGSHWNAWVYDRETAATPTKSDVYTLDYIACQTLLTSRIQQRDQLIAELTNTNRYAYK